MIFSTVVKALRGRRRWLKMKRKYGVDKNNIYVIMMPDSDREFNEIALRHIDDFLNYRKGSSVVVLTTDEWVASNASMFSERIVATEFITMQDYYYYRCYYCYYYHGFSEQFIIMSLQGYYGKRLMLTENVNGITKEDMACLGLYIIRDWKETKTYV
ncbi:MAG: hypothetical protein FWC26_14815 [Fibromonadales bacterium]|nr:hypothetical protein [Fibromonadales bacterium]